MPKYLVLLLLVFTGCKAIVVPSKPIEPKIEDVATISVELGREIVIAPVDVKPDIKPVSDICENCSGTGVVGDKTVGVKCPICDGSGKKKTNQEFARELLFGKPTIVKQVAKPVITPTITIRTSSTCVPCKVWLAKEASRYQANGWTIKQIDTKTGPWPRYEVNGSWMGLPFNFNHEGYMQTSDFNTKRLEAIKQSQSKPTQ